MNPDCPCPKTTCPNHGNCDKCKAYHLKVGGLSYCKRNPQRTGL
ncbi:MAG: hypothetical protein V1777_04470 [Candidatus Micrarchaeota archaeon]